MAGEAPDLRSAMQIARLLAAIARKYGEDDVIVLTPEEIAIPAGGVVREYDDDGNLTIAFVPSGNRSRDPGKSPGQ